MKSFLTVTALGLITLSSASMAITGLECQVEYHVNSVATNGPTVAGDSYLQFTDGSFVFNAQLPNAPDVLYMSITKTGERIPTAEYNGSASAGDRGRLVIPDGKNRRVALNCIVK